MRTARHFLRRQHAERRLLVRVAALQIAIRALLRVTDLRRVVRLAMWLARHRAAARDEVATIAWALAATAPRIGGSCLTQAIAALVVGGRTSPVSRFVIGVRRHAGRPEFHAWTEIAGRPVPAVPDVSSYTPLLNWF